MTRRCRARGRGGGALGHWRHHLDATSKMAAGELGHVTAAGPSPSPPVATATAAGPRAASGLRGAAPPKKVRPRAGPGAGVATVATAGRRAMDAPVSRRHPCLGTVPPPAPRLPGRAAPSAGGAPRRSLRDTQRNRGSRDICGPTGHSVKQKAVPSLPIARRGCQCRCLDLPAASSPRSPTEGDIEGGHCILMKQNAGRSRVVQCPLKLQKFKFPQPRAS